MRILLVAFSLLVTGLVAAQTPHAHAHDRAIHFPDTETYVTLVCDFHQHTVFSDGSVWPDIRVQEALRDSVDAISLTEHLEYQPKFADIPHPDRNRAYELAEQYARPYDLLVIPGAEITRKLPPGHNNAIFIEDANRLLIKDSLAVFEEANRQGAFTFWNHPNWIAQQRDGIATLTDFHRELIDKKLLHGIEVVNDLTISEEAFQIALDHDLAIMGTSDIHGLVDWQFNIAEGGHRPVTLVLAKERTAASIKEALFANRTVAWFDNTLVGREPEVRAVVEASLSITKVQYQGISSVVDVTIHNDSDAEYLLMNDSEYTLHANLDVVMLAPNGETTIQVKTRKQVAEFELRFDVLNAVTAPGKYLRIQLPVSVDL
jgi:hypothetical protein